MGAIPTGTTVLLRASLRPCTALSSPTRLGGPNETPGKPKPPWPPPTDVPSSSLDGELYPCELYDGQKVPKTCLGWSTHKYRNSQKWKYVCELCLIHQQNTIAGHKALRDYREGLDGEAASKAAAGLMIEEPSTVSTASSSWLPRRATVGQPKAALKATAKAQPAQVIKEEAPGLKAASIEALRQQFEEARGIDEPQRRQDRCTNGL